MAGKINKNIVHCCVDIFRQHSFENLEMNRSMYHNVLKATEIMKYVLPWNSLPF
jgi:hypothetical protein